MLMNIRMETWKVNLRHGIHLSSIIIFCVEFLWKIFSNSKKKTCMFVWWIWYSPSFIPISLFIWNTCNYWHFNCLMGLNWLKKHNTLVRRMKNNIIKEWKHMKKEVIPWPMCGVGLQVHLPQWSMACLFYNIKDFVSLHLWIRMIMLNYGLYIGKLIIMLKKHPHVINDDLGLDFYNLKNPQK